MKIEAHKDFVAKPQNCHQIVSIIVESVRARSCAIGLRHVPMESITKMRKKDERKEGCPAFYSTNGGFIEFYPASDRDRHLTVRYLSYNEI